MTGNENTVEVEVSEKENATKKICWYKSDRYDQRRDAYKQN